MGYGFIFSFFEQCKQLCVNPCIRSHTAISPITNSVTALRSKDWLSFGGAPLVAYQSYVNEMTLTSNKDTLI